MSPSPSDRVTAFIADFAEQAEALAPQFDDPEREGPPPFAEWGERLAQVASRHGVEGYRVENAGFSIPPAHHPDIDAVMGEQITGDRAIVSVHRNRRAGYRFVEYHLTRQADDWRISRISDYLADPDSPAIDPDQAASALATATNEAELRDLGESDRPDPGQALGDSPTAVGTFEHSGILAVGDFGYKLRDLVPLARRVRPGTARAEIALVEGRCGALRVTLADEPVASWARADAAGGGYVYGVDAGNLSVIDAEGAYRLTVRDKEGAWEGFGNQEVALLQVGDQPFGVIAHSGYGDGAYPAYWGLAADGEPVQLVLDFGLVPGAPWAQRD
ncbi:DUF4241 domain-containing protein [Aestuariimicrobium soli]|uniref:DUF4241 domain-containing protein n=1 Tax=Aestuariimicrobium soli TaxID=2035834 RepID=UPI003EBC9F3C